MNYVVFMTGGRKRKGKKTQVMEAVEKGLDRIFQHEAASGGDCAVREGQIGMGEGS